MEAISRRSSGVSSLPYSFVRPPRALKFGREVRTPARQAGLTSRALTLREIFFIEAAFCGVEEVILALFD